MFMFLKHECMKQRIYMCWMFYIIWTETQWLNFFYYWSSNSVAVQKPVGILHVNVVRARKLLKMDILGTSDPYVKLSFSGERLPPKRTSIKMKNLNPEWNEKFRLIVKDPQLQALELQVYDWDKVIPLLSFWSLKFTSCITKVLNL